MFQMESENSNPTVREAEKDDHPTPATLPAKPHKHPATNKKPYSRPKSRFTKPSSSTKVAFEGKKIPVSLSTRILTYYHRIHTSTSGISTFATDVYYTYARRDARLEKAYSLPLLRYVSTLALTYRLYSLGISIGHTLSPPVFLADLKEMIRNVSLPEPIAKYIESIGKVVAPMGICFIPHTPSSEEFKDKSTFPAGRDLLESEVDSLTNVQPKRLVEVEDLFLNTQAIEKYAMGSAVAAKFSALYRKVDWQRDEGDFASVVAYHEDEQGLTGYAPFEMEQVVAQLGATYRLRRIGERSEWYGDNECYRFVATTDRFMAGVFMIEKVLDLLVSDNRKRQETK